MTLENEILKKTDKSCAYTLSESHLMDSGVIFVVDNRCFLRFASKIGRCNENAAHRLTLRARNTTPYHWNVDAFFILLRIYKWRLFARIWVSSSHYKLKKSSFSFKEFSSGFPAYSTYLPCFVYSKQPLHIKRWSNGTSLRARFRLTNFFDNIFSYRLPYCLLIFTIPFCSSLFRWLKFSQRIVEEFFVAKSDRRRRWLVENCVLSNTSQQKNVHRVYSDSWDQPFAWPP